MFRPNTSLKKGGEKKLHTVPIIQHGRKLRPTSFIHQRTQLICSSPTFLGGSVPHDFLVPSPMGLSCTQMNLTITHRPPLLHTSFPSPCLLSLASPPCFVICFAPLSRLLLCLSAYCFSVHSLVHLNSLVDSFDLHVISFDSPFPPSCTFLFPQLVPSYSLTPSLSMSLPGWASWELKLTFQLHFDL